MDRITLLLTACLSTALLAACDSRYDTPTAKPSAEAAAAAVEPAPAPVPGTAAPAAPVAPGVPAAAPAVADTGTSYPAAREACLAEVARKTNVPRERLTITEVLWAQAGVGVTIQVPDAQAPWSCLSDEQGKVQGAAYTGTEGAL